MSRTISEGPSTFEAELTCHKCGTVFVATQDDLGIDRFKEHSDTYWFDGSAQAVDKFYAWCPHNCDLIFVPPDAIPELAKRKALRGR